MRHSRSLSKKRASPFPCLKSILSDRNLVERFNEVKVKLRAQEEDRLHERARLVLISNGQSVREDLRSLPAGS